MFSGEVDQVLDIISVRPVLVDLGASGSLPQTWNAIASKSVYIGFDPDSRELNAKGPSAFFESHIVPYAITPDGSSTVEFYLTQSPFCSSTLEPDTVSLDAYLNADLFTVESIATVRAGSLAEVLGELGFDRVHWFKADTQGTDLRLFRSLPEGVRAGILAIDMEPGLIDAYVGEDLFVDVQRYLSSRGFWLSRLDVKGAVRMRRSTLRKFGAERGDDFVTTAQEAIRSSPAWCEARYLRSVASLADRGAADWALTWVFAMVDDQPGFALDLAREYRRRFEDTAIGSMMVEGAIARLRELTRVPGYKRVWRRLVPTGMRRALFQSRQWFSLRGR